MAAQFPLSAQLLAAQANALSMQAQALQDQIATTQASLASLEAQLAAITAQQNDFQGAATLVAAPAQATPIGPGQSDSPSS